MALAISVLIPIPFPILIPVPRFQCRDLQMAPYLSQFISFAFPLLKNPFLLKRIVRPHEQYFHEVEQ